MLKWLAWDVLVLASRKHYTYGTVAVMTLRGQPLRVLWFSHN